jgi:hypothetical protein
MSKSKKKGSKEGREGRREGEMEERKEGSKASELTVVAYVYNLSTWEAEAGGWKV